MRRAGLGKLFNLMGGELRGDCFTTVFRLVIQTENGQGLSGGLEEVGTFILMRWEGLDNLFNLMVREPGGNLFIRASISMRQAGLGKFLTLIERAGLWKLFNLMGGELRKNSFIRAIILMGRAGHCKLFTLQVQDFLM